MFLNQILLVKICVKGTTIVIDLTNQTIFDRNDPFLNHSIRKVKSFPELVARALLSLE